MPFPPELLDLEWDLEWDRCPAHSYVYNLWQSTSLLSLFVLYKLEMIKAVENMK